MGLYFGPPTLIGNLMDMEIHQRCSDMQAIGQTYCNQELLLLWLWLWPWLWPWLLLLLLAISITRFHLMLLLVRVSSKRLRVMSFAHAAYHATPRHGVILLPIELCVGERALFYSRLRMGGSA